MIDMPHFVYYMSTPLVVQQSLNGASTIVTICTHIEAAIVRWPIILRGSFYNMAADIEVNVLRTNARCEKRFQKLTAHNI